MSETATIASSHSGRRPALDLSQTLPITRTPNLRLSSSSSSSPTETSFLLRDNFIYTSPSSSSSATTTYQISTRRTRSGLPWTLSLRRLLPTEARRLLLAPACAPPSPPIPYDADLTLYTATRIAVPFSLGPTPLLCLRGRTSPPSAVIILDAARKFWRVTPRRRHGPPTAAQEHRLQAAMRRRGYRADDDWRRELLYAVAAGGKWTDAAGAVRAREARDGGLLVAGGMEREERELLVACWAARNFVREAAA